jgi:hypothetical protein
MQHRIDVNPTSEHELYIKLFITNGGGWCSGHKSWS